MKSIDPLLMQVLESYSEGVYMVDAQRQITFWNRAAEKISGFSSEEVVGSLCMHNILNHIDKDGNPLCLGGCPLSTVLETGEEHEDSLFLHHAEGFRVPIHVRVLPVKDQHGNVEGAIEIFMETSAEAVIRSEERVFEAFCPTPTFEELIVNTQPVKRFLEDRLQKAEKIRRMPVAMLLMEIDHFAELSKELSANEKEQLLKTAAMSFGATLHPFEGISQWRESGFVAVTVNVSKARLRTMAEKAVFMANHSTPLRKTGKQLRITLSIGGTLVSPDDTVEMAMSRAEELLRKSQKRGGNQVTLCEEAFITAGH